MRRGLFVLTVFFGLQTLANEFGPMVSMQSDHIPCPGGTCKQTCKYDADALIEYQGFEVEGKITIQTNFDNQSIPGKIQLRTLVKVNVDMFGEAGLWDETNIIDAKTLRLDKTYNYLKLTMGPGEKSLKKAEWSHTEFQWPTNYVSAPTAFVTAIGGKSFEEVRSKSEKFYGYLKANKFGNDWMPEFHREKVERKTERDMEGFAENVLSPTFVSLYHLRFIPFMSDLRYNLFVNFSATRPKDLMGAFQVDLQGKPGNKATSVVFQGELAFGDFESLPGKPARFFVDKTTNQYERFEFNMQNVKQGIKATAWSTNVSCD